MPGLMVAMCRCLGGCLLTNLPGHRSGHGAEQPVVEQGDGRVVALVHVDVVGVMHDGDVLREPGA